MSEIRLTIDGKEVEVKQGATILEAAQSAGIYIPTLCYHPLLPSDGNCKLCIVEVEGRQDFPVSCITPAEEGMVVRTDTRTLRMLQKNTLKKIVAYHPCACLTCWRRQRCHPYDICLRNVEVTHRCVLCPANMNCELQRVSDFIGLVEEEFEYTWRNLPVYEEVFFDRDYNLCIGCTRCVRMCRDVKGVEAIKMVEGDGKIPAPHNDKSLKTSGCTLCCSCVEVCPTGALMDKMAEWEPGVKREEIISPCSFACPAGVDAPLYVALIHRGDYADALGVIRETVPFPGVLGRVCIHPCEQGCRRGALNQPIAIKALKWFAAEKGGEEWKKYSKKLPPTGKKVAVVGAGPAGLTAGYYLAKQGHSVTVFEALPTTGGMMRVGIPRYRLPDEALDAEINEIKNVGVDIKLNTRIDSVDTLLKQGYDAVFLGLGAHKGTTLGIEGEDLDGVMDGASFLRRASLGADVDLGDRVAVIGGGNVAIDSARTALRKGAREVTIVYRRTRAEMPASAEEVEAALEENIKILFLASPLKITREGARLRLTCQKMELGEPDASGRRRPVPVKGGESTLDFDSIIEAIGQIPDIPEKLGVKTGKGNVIVANPDTLETSAKGVYAGGDVVLGPASVIEAIAQGRRAASAIDKYLGGTGDISEVLAQKRKFNQCVGKDVEFQDRPLVHLKCVPVEKRVKNFEEVEMVYDEKTAVAEAQRCLQCAARRQMPSAPLSPVETMKVEEAKAGV